MLNFQVEILMVLGTESDITELIDRFTVRNLTKAVYQLLAAHPKESAARVFTPSSSVATWDLYFCGALHLIGGTP